MAPRKSRYTRKDLGYFSPYTQSDRLVPPGMTEYWAPDPKVVRATTKFLIDAKHRNQNSYTDPLTALYVIDMLQKWHPDNDIRARYMVGSLNYAQDKLLFEANNIGRILGELAEMADEAYTEYKALTPFHTMRDYRGRYYRINPAPTTYKWLMKIRLQLQEQVATMMEREAVGGVGNGQVAALTLINDPGPELL